ncbi:MAG: universal stress protein [Planctomycetota bacterium]
MIRIEKILCPVDFSAPSELALRYARMFAESSHAELHVLHVIEPLIYPSEYGLASMAAVDLEGEARSNAEKGLQGLAAKHLQGVAATLTLHVGRAVEAIVEEARKGSFDLIVIGTHGRTGVSHLLLGSTAEKVVRLAPCPVLTVKPTEVG